MRLAVSEWIQRCKPDTVMPPQLPEFVLFGDSLTEWSFDEDTEGFGWVLEQKYFEKVSILNAGT